ncbi:UdgX family uracil-DNA binding protein [Rhodococcus sp. D2-41]|uniref:UdgX family uracil-DNA binding protein n=1 Tax=Speluncibacter jeojiensis TaxID=2710754 RepID=UPI0024100720|nr:UdgX family uracil-DNA binding protein [Rhodococcus sp. D2-41]MDG3010795.1 UdgX family uracil-DNA binding protein [Rhodococcus sp. D2-41]
MTGAENYLPRDRTISALAAAARCCQGCPLYEPATQTVFGEGLASAALMLIGEQPGDREDRAGQPFVGPAGTLLHRALDDAGIDADRVYRTNAVKHFTFTRQIGGKRRIHQRPSRTEVVSCRPWLLAEIEALRPQVIVCLGATAAQSLYGSAFRITAHRGEVLRLPREIGPTARCPALVVVTIHPSAVLRDRDEARRRDAYDAFVADLRGARNLIPARAGSGSRG